MSLFLLHASFLVAQVLLNEINKVPDLSWRF